MNVKHEKPQIRDFLGQNCRYCDKTVIESEASITHSYWQGLPYLCHKSCKGDGVKQEAFNCQIIDADCNDCKHFRRGELLPIVRSWLKKPNGKMVEITHQPDVFNGECLKFNKKTIGQPNKQSGFECFEHRKL